MKVTEILMLTIPWYIKHIDNKELLIQKRKLKQQALLLAKINNINKLT